MSAVIVTLARVMPRRAPAPAASGLAHDLPARLHFWRGASGRRYAHTVYGLLECPPLPEAAYLLVRRDACGSRTLLDVGLGESDAPTLNLAQVRQHGASLGANEVHVHFLAETSEQRLRILADLRTAECGTPAPASGASSRPVGAQPVEKRAAPAAAKLAHRRGS
jgi:hypothetical protein